jgi:hypothetical protein
MKKRRSNHASPWRRTGSTIVLDSIALPAKSIAHDGMAD